MKVKYRLDIVDKSKVSRDGNVRSVTVRYVLVSENITFVLVQRSVQRLSRILPVEDQTSSVVEKGHEFYVECSLLSIFGVGRRLFLTGEGGGIVICFTLINRF